MKGLVEYSIWNVEQQLNSAGANFTVQQSAIKLEIQLNHWNFSQASNSLRLHLNLATQPAVTSTQSLPSGNSNITTFILNSGNSLFTTVNLINYCVVDNSSFVPVTFSINNTGSVIDLIVHLPHFEASLIYDPDFSVVLGGSGNGGSSRNLNLLALLSLLVIPLSMIAVVALGFFLYMLIQRRNRKAFRGSVNFGPRDTEDSL